MATTLTDIRYAVEKATKDELDPLDVIAWCNDAQSELMIMVELPSTDPIAVNTTDVAYNEPADIKRINRLWLTSERNQGVDRDIPKSYRRYGGQIIFETPFGQEDTLNVDFYKHLKHFTAVTDTIDLEDRYASLYTSYVQAQYYDLPHVIASMGEAQAKRQYEKHYGRHATIKDAIATQFTLQTQPSTIKEAW